MELSTPNSAKRLAEAIYQEMLVAIIRFFFFILRRMGKSKAQAPALARIRYMCFDLTHAPVATAARAAATGLVSM